MTNNSETSADLDLFAMMVSRLLRQRGLTRMPPRADFSVQERGRYGDGRPDVNASVDLGRGVRVLVTGSWIHDGWDDLKRLSGIACEFADAIETALDNAQSYREVVSEVRAAARSGVAKAARRGAPWKVVSIEPSPVLAGSVEDPAATLTLQVLGETPHPKMLTIDARCAEDVAEALDAIRDEQVLLAHAWQQHASAGATGAIDAVLHADLVAAGEDVPAILRLLGEVQERVIDLDKAGGGRRTLFWKDGVVHGHVYPHPDIHWQNGLLSFRTAPDGFGPDWTGRTLTTFLPDRRFQNVAIRRVSGRPGGQGMAWCDAPTLLFDAGSGRVWSQQPRALAA